MTTYAESYRTLLLDCMPRPIRSEREYKKACRQISDLMAKGTSLSRAESEMIEVLSLLVGQFESSRFPMRDASPAEVLSFLIESRGVTKAAVARETGIARSLITDVLAGRRQISMANTAKLADYFDVAPDVFIAKA